MIGCEECYSEQSRITPLLGARACLEQHEQYICGTCGRCICIAKDTKRGLQRWHFPFQSLKNAILYLRTADVTHKSSCGIYQIQDQNGRLAYKVFPSDKALTSYLNKHKTKQCISMQAVYRNGAYREFPNTQIRKLKQQEVEKYLLEREMAEK
ncbi:hypothetical protein [Culicoidibacter larvae]|uniref:Uncharacterized protein n=1 Tax=Culicoidibacter larvae TaxID=2579976 RepID=A0A5R8QGD1_9FIRM|nr:hypothetical protein [Culicoidibacter larvae]TLG76770.1 hypothetical protein FEZ08_03905 [Culicoidibacter larvae]